MAVSTMSISEDPYASLTSPDLDVYSTVGVTSHKGSGAKSTVKSGKSSHPFKLAAVGLGLLCAILLTATIALFVLFMRERDLEMLNAQNYNNLRDEKAKLQGDYNRLSNEKNQLQRDYNRQKGQCSTCPEGWKQSCKCYFFSTDLLSGENWEESRNYCKRQGAELVIINSQEEQEFINQQAKAYSHWIGLKYSADRNRWEWVDGTILQQSFWRPGEPTKSGQCALTKPPEELWLNYPCNDNRFGWICETDASCV